MSTDERFDAALENDVIDPRARTGTIRFPRTNLRKPRTLIGCMVLAGILATAWSLTVTSRIESRAEVMVQRTENNVLDGKKTSHRRSLQDVMRTCQKAFTCDQVLEGAIARLPNELRIEFKEFPKSRWVSELRKSLSISVSRQTCRLSIRYTSNDPQTSAFVLNAVIDSYLEYMRTREPLILQDQLKQLSEQKAKTEIELWQTERELSELKQNSGILPQGETNVPVVIQNAIKLNDALFDAQRKAIDAHTLVQTVQTALATGSDLRPLLQQVAADLSIDVIMRELGMSSQESIDLWEDELLSDQLELQTLAKSLNENDPEIIQLTHRIETTRNWLADQSRSMLLAIKPFRDQGLGPKLFQLAQQQYFQAKANEEAVRKEFDAIRSEAIRMNGRLAEIESLEMTLQRMRGYYDLILKQIAKVQSNANSGLKFTVTKPAKVTPVSISPWVSTAIVVCLIVGGIAAACLIRRMNSRDDRFQSVAEIQSRLRLPQLSIIHEMKHLAGAGLETISDSAHCESREFESFRTLHTSIALSALDTRRLVLTSAESDIGKSTTLANLAVAFAQAKKKTLLIDANLRQSGLTRLLNLVGPRGLSAVLQDTKAIEECCLENTFNLGVENLDVMPSGAWSGNPSELLATERFSDIMAWADPRYDQILVDVPPVLAASDAAIVGRVVDGAILVIRPDTDRRKSVLRTIATCRATEVPVVGFVASFAAERSSVVDGSGGAPDYQAIPHQS